MNKKHQSPEFTIIRQSQANAKFFVASGGDAGGFTGGGTQGGPNNSASHYDGGTTLNM